MNVLKCQCSQQMGLWRGLQVFWHLPRTPESREGTLRYNLSLLSCPTKSTLPSITICPPFLPSFLPSLKSISPSIFPTPPPTHSVWKHQSILCCIDYCTLALSRWTALIHHTHGAVCQQNQSIFHFHNTERRGEMESGRKTKDWMRVGERTK